MPESGSDHMRDLILRTIDIFNRYRDPEVTLTLVEIDKDGFTLDFEGSFCTSCGVRDHFEDFIYELKTINKNVKAELAATKPTGLESFRVKYRIKDNCSDNTAQDVNEDTMFREFLLENGLSFEEYLASNSCTKDVLMFHFRTWLFEREKGNKNRLLLDGHIVHVFFQVLECLFLSPHFS
jgi:hypothetical protein